MNSLWLENKKLTFRNNSSIGEISSNEAFVKVRLAGICTTDLEMVKGYYGFTGIPGHEFVGEVVESPTVREWIGKRVVGGINITCGDCDACKRGNINHCQNRKTIGLIGHDGVFGEYIRLPLKNLTEIPEQVSDEKAVSVIK